MAYLPVFEKSILCLLDALSLLARNTDTRLLNDKRHMWIDAFVVSRLASRVLGFSGSPVFAPSTNTNTPNSNSTRIEDPHETSEG